MEIIEPPQSSTRLDSSIEYWGLVRRLVEQLRALESEAGISEEAERVRNGHDWQHRKHRALYFSVPDNHLRWALIAKDREITRASRMEYLAQLQEAADSVAESAATGRYWYCFALLCAFSLVAIGWQIFHTFGAIMGALIGGYIGKEAEIYARLDRADAIKKAECQLKITRASVSQILENMEYTFSETEAHRGIPDETETSG